MSRPHKGSMVNLVADYRAHVVDDHDRTDYGNNVTGFHDRHFPDCKDAPQLKDYKFGNENTIQNETLERFRSR